MASWCGLANSTTACRSSKISRILNPLTNKKQKLHIMGVHERCSMGSVTAYTRLHRLPITDKERSSKTSLFVNASSEATEPTFNMRTPAFNLNH
eukprot:scaffold17681_cov155-Amphora_coffeaeformis.AAC.2